MIKTELLKDDTLIRHYSDSGMKLLQVETGIMYDEAIDIVPCQYTYEETENPVEQDELADAINALNILGVE
jgi:glutaredoxin 2